MNSTTDSIIAIQTHPNDSQPGAIAHDQHPQLSWLSKLWNAIMIAFEPNNEPILWQRCDRNGNLYWEVYDPVSDRTVYLASEGEVRLWLEHLPYLR